MRELSFDLREFGLACQQWHAGQGDPVYAVGSSCFAGLPENLDEDTVSSAQSSLERLGRAQPDSDAADLARQCGELANVLWPVTWGSGMIGCLYDSGPHRATDVDEAISSLLFNFEDCLEEGEEARMRNALEHGGCHYFENPEKAGAQFCEVSF